MLLGRYRGVVFIHDEAGTAGFAGGQHRTAQVFHLLGQRFVAAAVKVDAQQAHYAAGAVLDEHTVGVHLLSGDRGTFKGQHIVLGLIQTTGEELQHFVAQGRPEMAACQVAVGNRNDLVGILRQLMERHLKIRAENVAQKVHQQRVMPPNLFIHTIFLLLLFGCGLLLLCGV